MDGIGSHGLAAEGLHVLRIDAKSYRSLVTSDSAILTSDV